jgi:hypothetical protein
MGRFKVRPCFYTNSLGRSPCLCQEYFLRKLPNFGPSASHSAYYTVRAFQPLGTQVLSVDRLLADLHRPSGAGAFGGRRLLPICRPAGPKQPSSQTAIEYEYEYRFAEYEYEE